MLKTGGSIQTLTGSNSFSGGTTISGGALVIGAAGALPSQGDVANDATLEVDANSSAGNIIGSGAVTVAAGVTLSANNLIQDSLTMALGGTAPAANAKISTTFALSLAHLTVTLAGGFAPAAGNSFDLLDWGSIAAPFSSVTLPTLSGSLSWNTSLLYTTGVISVVGTSVPGDYNGRRYRRRGRLYYLARYARLDG